MAIYIAGGWETVVAVRTLTVTWKTRPGRESESHLLVVLLFGSYFSSLTIGFNVSAILRSCTMEGSAKLCTCIVISTKLWDDMSVVLLVSPNFGTFWTWK